MKRIPFTQYRLVSESEALEISQALELGARAMMQYIQEYQELQHIVKEQAQAMTTLMAVQNRMADAVQAAVNEGASAEDLAHNLTVILGEYID